jgi:hypothetical protein
MNNLINNPMYNLIGIVIILFILYFISSKEQFDNTEQSYYIDKIGKTPIETNDLPLTLTDIIELHYINTVTDETKFLLTKGHYKHSESKNAMTLSNNKSEKYQLIHLKNDIPFSGILF